MGVIPGVRHPLPGPGGRAECARMTAPARLAWLFDVDGTLLTTDGAARRAFVRAVRDVLGRDDDLRDIAFAGRTDPLILADILRKHGVEREPDVEARFWDSVMACMREEMTPGRGALLAGVLALLDRIDQEPGWVATLLTGNMRRMAALKLEHFGITERFALGAFGDEAEDRDALAVLAVRRVAERYGLPPSRCIVIGDTPYDVQCARAAGAHAVAVATGVIPRAALEAARPDRVLDDLADTEGVMQWARAIENGAGSGAPPRPAM